MSNTCIIYHVFIQSAICTCKFTLCAIYNEFPNKVNL